MHKLLTDWDKRYAAAIKARDAAKAAVVTKDEARAALEESIRSTARLIQANDMVTDAARDEAGLPVHKTTRTPVAVPHTFPVGSVIASDRLQHSLFFSDVATPTRRAKPTGVSGCEIHVSVSEHAPRDPADYRFVSLATRTPETVKFDAEDGGKMAHYLLRWLNTKGEPGPWSQVVSATIPAV